jgi:hypothetical protein
MSTQPGAVSRISEEGISRRKFGSLATGQGDFGKGMGEKRRELTEGEWDDWGEMQLTDGR